MTEQDFKTKGLAELGSFLQELPEKLRTNVMAAALRAGAAPIQEAAKQGIHSRTGELAEGIKIRSKRVGTTVIARIVLTGKHAFVGNWLEFTGASAHVIKARHARFLFFDGKVVSKVENPGFAPKPFLRPALQQHAADAIKTVGDYLKGRLASKAGFNTADIDVEVEEK